MTKARNLLEKQIIADAKNGDTTVLAEILESLTDDHIFGSLSDKNQASLNFTQLKQGTRIKALVDTRGVSNSYNTPEQIDIPRGTILHVSGSGTRFGDAFCNIVTGTPIKHIRGGEHKEMNIGETVGLGCGYNSAPYSLGQIDIRVWEIIE